MVRPGGASLSVRVRKSAVLSVLVFANALLSLRAQTFSTYLPPDPLAREEHDPLWQLGVFDLHARAAAVTLYDDNILLRSRPPQDDFIYVLAPGLSVTKTGGPDADAATSMALSYSPAFVFFTEHDTNNSIDHIAHFNGALTLAKLNISVYQDYESSEAGVIDVGARVGVDLYRGGVRARYQATEKTAVELGGNYRVLDYETLIDSTEWLEDNALHYQVTPKMLLGAGISVGQLYVDDRVTRTNVIRGGAQTFWTPSVRAAYRTTERTDVSASIGGESRSYADGSSSFEPVFSIAATYRPRETTVIALEGHRRQLNSAVLSGENYVSTGFVLSFRQQFYERFRGILNFGYDNADYQPAQRGVKSTRTDDYYLLRYGLDVILARSWTIGIFHQYREVISSSAFSFNNNQVGLQTVWSY